MSNRVIVWTRREIRAQSTGDGTKSYSEGQKKVKHRIPIDKIIKQLQKYVKSTVQILDL